MRADDLLDRFVQVRSDVTSLEEAAEAIGVTFAALEKGLERARQRGDERGVYTPLRTRTRKPAPREILVERYAALSNAERATYAGAAHALGTTTDALASALSRVRRSGGEVPPVLDREALLEDWEVLRDGGEHWSRAAGRLGVSVPTLLSVLGDARRAGDTRGALDLDRLHQLGSITYPAPGGTP